MAKFTTATTDFSALTPSDYPAVGSYTYGIDIDGSMKKIDSDGVITQIGAPGLSYAGIHLMGVSGNSSYPIATAGQVFRTEFTPQGIAASLFLQSGFTTIEVEEGDLIVCITDTPDPSVGGTNDNFIIVRKNLVKPATADDMTYGYSGNIYTNPEQVKTAIDAGKDAYISNVTSSVVSGSRLSYVGDVVGSFVAGKVYSFIPDVTYTTPSLGGYSCNNASINNHTIFRTINDMTLRNGDITAGVPCLMVYRADGSFLLMNALFPDPAVDYLPLSITADNIAAAWPSYRAGADMATASLARGFDWGGTGATDFKVRGGRAGMTFYNVSDFDAEIYLYTFNDRAGIDMWGWACLLFSDEYSSTFGFDENKRLGVEGLAEYATGAAAITAGLTSGKSFYQTRSGEFKIAVPSLLASDITGLTDIDLTNARCEVDLTSSNVTEEITSLSTFPTGTSIKFYPASGLSVTFTPGGFRTAGGVAAVINGTNGDWVQFTERNGIIYQTGGETY